MSDKTFFNMLHRITTFATKPRIKLHYTYYLLLLPTFLLFVNLSLIDRYNRGSIAYLTASSVFKSLDCFVFIVRKIIRKSILYLNDSTLEEWIRKIAMIWINVLCNKLATKQRRTQVILLFFYSLYQSADEFSAI